MNRFRIAAIVSLVAAATLSTTAGASTLFQDGYAAANWTITPHDYSGHGFNSYSVTTNSLTSLRFDYDYGHYAATGIDFGIEVVYDNVSDATQTLSFHVDFNSYQAYSENTSDVYMFSNGPGGYSQTRIGGFNFSGDYTLPVFAGQSWGFIVHASNNDYDSRAIAQLDVTAVPEPSTFVLGGLGLLGLGLAARRRTDRRA